MEPTEESEAAVKDKLRDMDQRRQWPSGDVEVTEMPFRVCYGPSELVRFNWMDLPGGSFTTMQGMILQRNEIGCPLKSLKNSYGIATPWSTC